MVFLDSECWGKSLLASVASSISASLVSVTEYRTGQTAVHFTQAWARMDLLIQEVAPATPCSETGLEYNLSYLGPFLFLHNPPPLPLLDFTFCLFDFSHGERESPQRWLIALLPVHCVSSAFPSKYHSGSGMGTPDHFLACYLCSLWLLPLSVLCAFTYWVPFPGTPPSPEELCSPG